MRVPRTQICPSKATSLTASVFLPTTVIFQLYLISPKSVLNSLEVATLLTTPLTTVLIFKKLVKSSHCINLSIVS